MKCSKVRRKAVALLLGAVCAAAPAASAAEQPGEPRAREADAELQSSFTTKRTG